MLTFTLEEIAFEDVEMEGQASVLGNSCIQSINNPTSGSIDAT
jgi:hypothetical protein